MRDGVRIASGRPGVGEYAAYAADDIAFVVGSDAVAALEAQLGDAMGFLEPLDERDVAGLRYAPGKWTVKDVVGHMADDERIFAYRMLCVARGEPLALPGFDENLYAEAAGAERRALADLLAEYRSVRGATLSFLRALAPDDWRRRGVVNGHEASVRGLAFHVAGHELHHLRVLRAKYLPALAGDRKESP